MPAQVGDDVKDYFQLECGENTIRLGMGVEVKGGKTTTAAT